MGEEAAAITIDYMKKDDLDKVMAVEKASFSMPWSRNLFLAEFRSPRISTLMVALSDVRVREVAGYIIFWVVEDEMHILNLATAPDSRRKGVARKLVLASVKRASEKGAQRAFLEVRASNLAADRLYSGLGFTGASIRREYYADPVEDAIVMTLEREAFESRALRPWQPIT
jgi:[ribosomal protein S18]-alanine N-acetyltransferase